MDWSKRLSLALAALAVSATMGSQVTALTRADLATINEFVAAKDERGLRAFLLQNPQLLDNSPVGQILRDYVEAPPRNQVFTSLGWTATVPDEVVAVMNAAKTDPSLY